MAARDNVDLDRIVDYKAEYTAAISKETNKNIIPKIRYISFFFRLLQICFAPAIFRISAPSYLWQLIICISFLPSLKSFAIHRVS